jgi:hypothetical protein
MLFWFLGLFWGFCGFSWFSFLGFVEVFCVWVLFGSYVYFLCT